MRRFALLLSAASLLASCQGGAGPGMFWLLLAALGLVGWWGCEGGGAGPGDAGIGPEAGARLDGGPDAAGTWSRCCNNGRTESCYCPPAMACNYGWSSLFCADGRCAENAATVAPSFCGPDGGTDAGDAADAPADAPADGPADVPPEAVRDAGPDGIWFQCCEHGQLTTCYCPPMWACNYYGHVICGDGTCVARNVPLPDAAAAQCPADAGAH